jgi:hypothetical protein
MQQIVIMRIFFAAFILSDSCPCWLLADYKPVTVVLVWSGKLLLAFATTIILDFGPAGLTSIKCQMTLE